MKPKVSPLQIVDFAITGFEFSMVYPSAEEDVTEHFKHYDLDIDFGLSTDDFVRAFIKAEINRGESRKHGYSIFAEAVCIFSFEDADLPAEVKNSLEGFSTIYIALNSLRGLISNFTANAPFGRYILPSIDLNDLIEKKKASLLKNGSVKKKNSKAKTGKKNITTNKISS
jgi:hypothetical protein